MLRRWWPLVIDRDVGSDPLGVHVVVFTGPVPVLKRSHDKIRIYIQRIGFQVLNVIDGLVIDLNTRAVDGGFHDALPRRTCNTNRKNQYGYKSFHSQFCTNLVYNLVSAEVVLVFFKITKRAMRPDMSYIRCWR